MVKHAAQWPAQIENGLRELDATRKLLEKRWQQQTLAPKPQQPCDLGLFSDDKDQTEMF